MRILPGVLLVSVLAACGSTTANDAPPSDVPQDTRILVDVDGTSVELTSDTGATTDSRRRLTVAGNLVEQGKLTWAVSIRLPLRDEPRGDYDVDQGGAEILLTDRSAFYEARNGTVHVDRLESKGGVVEGRFEADLVITSSTDAPFKRQIRSGSFKVKNIGGVSE